MPIHGDGGHARVVRELVLTPPANGWIIAIGDNATRRDVAQKYTTFATGIHASAVISRSAEIGVGTVVMAGAIIQPNVKVGRHVILNSRSILEHDTIVGDFAHIGPGAITCGHVIVGDGAFMGALSVAVPQARIPAWYEVKAGEVFESSNPRQAEKFWRRVEKTKECWLWKGTKNKDGYGLTTYSSKQFLSHRLSWILTYGRVPTGLFVCHKCDVRNCVNPEHLYVGTQKENMRDMVNRRRTIWDKK